MLEHHVVDWDNAYANGANIAGSDRWPAAWVGPAQAFREKLAAEGRAKLGVAYGDRPRNRLDLFLPESEPKGLVVFVHGGYWMAFDNSTWSHLAAGAVESGLCRGDAVLHALSGGAAGRDRARDRRGDRQGGHAGRRPDHADRPFRRRTSGQPDDLATTPLSQAVQRRIRNVVSIAGLHDLRPLMNTAMNKTLRIDEAEALTESPALLRPMENARITCWVGGGERGEFLRQSALLANIWIGLGATTAMIAEPDRHHFSIIDGLADANHALTRTLLS